MKEEFEEKLMKFVSTLRSEIDEKLTERISKVKEKCEDKLHERDATISKHEEALSLEEDLNKKQAIANEEYAKQIEDLKPVMVNQEELIVKNGNKITELTDSGETTANDVKGLKNETAELSVCIELISGEVKVLFSKANTFGEQIETIKLKRTAFHEAASTELKELKTYANNELCPFAEKLKEQLKEQVDLIESQGDKMRRQER
eukprot:CAMPEP_0202442282 /NCGR_PEP_ID=MMETSP1360-20130828/1742_1 /ASSEMBLY_ACC=CAM_ASM_000848 /TAXON_ID=515479 /ORGANISM="Licmophora paradoxa, Strain CCMP2313" /LENGTH=203 /DNA_ID=CAMNT_0049057607 /DNA_START=3221 /DNA_END=3833 /DNA_ORIENTATION=-